MRGGMAIGALAMGSRERGGFSDTQVELLKTFAEQAVIAIGSAETYRALQIRTEDLHRSLDYQGATIDVLKVMSTSTSDTQPVFDIILRPRDDVVRLPVWWSWRVRRRTDAPPGRGRAFDPDMARRSARRLSQTPLRREHGRTGHSGRAIHYVRDYLAEPDIGQTCRDMDHDPLSTVPLFRDEPW